jgi:hypothetical protein
MLKACLHAGFNLDVHAALHQASLEVHTQHMLLLHVLTVAVIHSSECKWVALVAG